MSPCLTERKTVPHPVSALSLSLSCPWNSRDSLPAPARGAPSCPHVRARQAAPPPPQETESPAEATGARRSQADGTEPGHAGGPSGHPSFIICRGCEGPPRSRRSFCIGVSRSSKRTGAGRCGAGWRGLAGRAGPFQHSCRRGRRRQGEGKRRSKKDVWVWWVAQGHTPGI